MTRAGDCATVRAERHAPNPPCMSTKRAFRRPRDSIPQTNCIVMTTTGKGTTVWTKRDTTYLVSMFGECSLERAFFRIP